MNVQIKNTTKEGALVIHVEGELDLYTASRLKDALAEGLDGGRRWVVVDLLEVGFLDSTALGVLVGTMRRLKQDSGSLHLVMNDPHLTKIFRITGFEGVFPICLLYTSDAADDLTRVDLGGRRIIKKKKK